ncbi:unnamed protein product, partial [Rotaria sp. Silwood2]
MILTTAQTACRPERHLLEQYKSLLVLH